jgi:hypothetical protein
MGKIGSKAMSFRLEQPSIDRAVHYGNSTALGPHTCATHLCLALMTKRLGRPIQAPPARGSPTMGKRQQTSKFRTITKKFTPVQDHSLLVTPSHDLPSISMYR